MRKGLVKVVSLFTSGILVAGLCGCSSDSVAATVNGTEIYESEVTAYIDSFRTSYSLTDDSDWASYLSTYGYTAEDLREETINSLARTVLIDQAAEENGVTVDDSELDSAIDSVKSNFSSDSEYEEALETYGMTEDDLRENYRSAYLEEGLEDAVITVTLTDEDIQDYLTVYASTYEGAKRSSHILVDDEDTATQVIAEINAGKDFATAAQEYSTDSSASSGGDVGWDCETQFVDEYQEALDELSLDEMTQTPVESTYGYHVIKCTGVLALQYDESGNALVSSIPEDLYDYVESEAEEYKKSEEFDLYVDDLVASADIVINEMPSGLSYDVEETTDDTTSEDATTTEDTSTTDDSTSTDTSTTDTTSDDASTTSDSTSADESATESTE